MANPFKKISDVLGGGKSPDPVTPKQAEQDLSDFYRAREVERNAERFKRAKDLAKEKLKKKRGASNYPEERND